jgi:hypothetical protein
MAILKGDLSFNFSELYLRRNGMRMYNLPICLSRPIYLSVCLSACTATCLPVYLSSYLIYLIHQSNLSNYLSMYHLSNLSIYCACLSALPPAYLHACLSVCRSVFLSVGNICLYICICLSIQEHEYLRYQLHGAESFLRS